MKVLPFILVQLLESDEGHLGGVLGNDGEAGDTVGLLTDAFLDVGYLVCFVAYIAAEISHTSEYFKPVVGEACLGVFDHFRFNHQD